MSNTDRSSKGKARAGEEDYAQSFAFLSLSDCGDPLAPRADPYGSSYPDVYGSSYEQTYTGSDPHSWTTQSSLAPMQASAAYGGTSGYSNSYSTTPATSSIGGYEYQSQPSGTSNYGGYAGYDAVSITSSSVPSYGGGSVRGWSETPSQRTAASSAPSAHSNRTDVNNTIHRQMPPNERYQLPCEFRSLTGCDRVFPGDDEHGWIEHIEGHLQSQFPTRLRCWFCSEHQFDARKTSGGDIRSNFTTRMQHIRDHIVYEGYRTAQMQKDMYLITHLLEHNLIDRNTYDSIASPLSVPRIPGSNDRHSSHWAPRRRLPQVEEEVAESSSRPQYRSAHRRRYGYSHRNILTGGGGGVCGLLSVPAGVRLDEPVPVPLRRPSNSPYYSRRMLENIPLEGSSVSSTKTAREHPKDQSIGHVDHERVINTVVNELHQIDTGFVGKADGSSSARIEPLLSPPLSPDYSNVGPSSNPSDTSSPESDSFWFSEYSEEEDKRLAEDHPFMQFKGLAVAKVFETFGSWKGPQSEQGPPCDGVDKSDTAANQAKGKGTESRPTKRTWADQSDNGENANNENEPTSNHVSGIKGPGASGRQLTFACPYTKKDPMSYRDCYTKKLTRIRDVKQHLGRCHRNPPYCPRCMGTFQTEEERDGHIREFSCPSRPPTRLDGITESQGRQLSKKSAPNTSPEAQWFVVFDIVFPGHTPRPQSPYVDRELLQDITHYQDFLTSHGPRILSEVLESRGIITFNYLANDQLDLTAFQQTVLEEGLGRIFEQWLARRGSDPPDPDVSSSSSGSNSQDNPQSSSQSSEGIGNTSAHDSGAVPLEAIRSPPGGGPLDEPPEDEIEPQNSIEQTSSGGGTESTFEFVNWDVDPSAGTTHDNSDEEPVSSSSRHQLAYGSHDRHSSNRTHRRRLPQVEEEVVVQSSTRHQRYEHRREHNREHGSSSRKHRRR